MSNQNLATYRHLLVEPTALPVDVINQFTFRHNAKAWAYTGFLPVLRKVGQRMYYARLNFNIRRIREEFFQFTTAYYHEKFRELLCLPRAGI